MPEFQLDFDITTPSIEADFVLYAPADAYDFQEGFIVDGRRVSLAPSTNNSIGGVIIGDNINITEEGVISIPQATNEVSGVIRIATDEEAVDGTIVNLCINPKQLTEAVGDKISLNDLSSVSPILYDSTTGIFSADFDSEPTEDSEKFLTSGVIKASLDEKQDVIPDLDEIREGASAGDTALQPGADISLLNNDANYQENVIEIVEVNNVPQEVANKTVNIAVPTQASDIGALPDTTTIYDLTTSAQQDVLDSGITSNDVSLIQSALQPNDNISKLTNDVGYITGIIASDVTTALGYVPYNSSNPNNYQQNVIETIKVNDTTQTVTNKTVNINVPTDTSDLTNGAGFITSASLANYATKDYVDSQGFLTEITSSDVTTALGYTPYNSSNPSGYQANVIETIKVNNVAQTVTSKAVNITVPTDTSDLTNGAGFITGIDSSDVIEALGYTPYDSTNPNGYTSNVGTVTSVNNTQPDSNGNVNLVIPEPSEIIVDQVYDSTSENAQSGVAIAGAGFLKGITSSDVTSALGYVPYNSTNPNGYEANVIETVKVNNVAQTVTNKAVNIPVPTQASDIGAVPTSRTVNRKALTTDISLDSSDIGALPDTTTINDLTTTVQQEALDSGANTTNIGQIATNTSNIATNTNSITTINSKIPAQATSTNQLADKEFVNSSIASNTANFIGTFANVQSLESYSGTITNNDYAFVVNSVVTDNGNDWATFSALDAYDKTLLTNFDYAWVINGSNFDLYRFDIVAQEWILRASDTPKEGITLNSAYNRYKYSVDAFNRNAFTVVGNPTVTDEGVASGFNSSNYVKTPTISADLSKPFVIEGNFITTSPTTQQTVFGTTVIDTNNTIRTFALQIYTTGVLYFYCPLSVGGNWIVGTTTLTANTQYYYRLVYDGNGNIKWYYGTDQDNLIEQTAGALLGSTLNNYITLGIGYAISNPVLGSIDLKAFSITVDGVEVLSGQGAWDYEYTLNNSSFTAQQWAAINSEITSGDVALIQTALQPNDNISKLTNDVGYITGIDSTAVTTALGYTPYNSSNPSGYQANVIEAIQVNGTTQTVTNKTVNIPVPTDTSDLTNGAGFITGIDSTAVVNALGYTPYNSSNPDGYISGITSSDVTTALGYTPVSPEKAVKSGGSKNQTLVKNSDDNYDTKWEDPDNLQMFDKTKFTVVGSPTITSDGIITSWGTNDKLNTSTISGGGSTNYEIHYRLLTPLHKFTTNNVGYTQPLFISNTGDKTWQLQFYTENTTSLNAHNAGYTYAGLIPNSATTLATINYVDLVIKNDGINFSISTYKPDGTLIKETISASASADLPFETVILHTNNNSFFTTATPLYSIDLKYLRVYIDGVEVFNGTIPLCERIPSNNNQLVNGAGYITGIDSTAVTNALGYTPYNATNPSGYQANVIETIKVNDTTQTITNKTVNITVPTDTADLTNGAGFVTSASLATTLEDYALASSVPTKVSDLTNDSGYITGISSSDVTTALGYTPYNSTNPNGYQANVIETIKVNGTAQTVTSKAVNIPVPTDTGDLTNGAGYITGIDSSDVTSALGYTPQETLVSGTNIKTINNNSLLGSGNITIDSLPAQSGQSGKFLTTNGSAASWGTPTDTKNTAGSTDTSSKIFLVGATSQAANPQTYSHDTAFVDTSGQLNSANPAASTNSTVVATTKWVTDKGYLTSHQTIKVNGVTGATTNNYGVCSTAAGTAQKDVTLTAGTFTLETGARVLVKFTVTNTAASPTLNVGSTGAKAIQYRGSAITTGYLAANRTYEFVYDGTNYQLIGDINTDADSKTAQNISTTDNTYPMLLGYTANATANIGNQPTLFGSGIKANPSTSQVVANSYAFGTNATMQYNSTTEAIEFVFS